MLNPRKRLFPYCNFVLSINWENKNH